MSILFIAFFTLMGQAIYLSESTHKITRGEKNRLNSRQTFKLLCISFGLQVMSNIYYTEFQRNERQGTIQRILGIYFLPFSSISFSSFFRETKSTCQKNGYLSFYSLTYHNDCKYISIKPNCLHSCLFTTVHSALVCNLAPQRKESYGFVSAILETILRGEE